MRFAPVLLLLALGCTTTDTGGSGEDQAPEATITAPEGGASVPEGYLVHFTGIVQDADDADGLTATWKTASRDLCAEAPVAGDGTVSCDAVIGLEDTTVILVGRDPKDVTGTATIGLTVTPTLPPTATILTPDGEGPYYAGVAIPVTATVADAEDAPDKLSVAWADGATALSLDSTPDSTGALAGSLTLAAGEHDLTLTVTDATGKTGSATTHLSVKAENTPPVCSLTSPEDGGAAGQGVTVSFAGTITDADVASDLLTYTLASDKDGIFASGDVAADGSLAAKVSTLSVGTHRITLTGTDELGGTCTDTIQFSVGSPPAVEIDAPAEGDLFNEDEVISFVGLVDDESTPLPSLAIDWESDVDGPLDFTDADASGVVGFESDALSYGDHDISLTVTDLDGLYSTADVRITINDLPSAPGLTLSPSSPSTDDALSVAVSTASSDWEGNAITYSYAWTVNGAATAYTSTSIPASATTRDEVWRVTVTPNDGWGNGDAATASVTIADTAPVLASVSLSPSSPKEGDTLTCTPGSASDIDGDTLSYTYAWTVNGVAVAPTTATLASTYWDRGDTVACKVTPSDGTKSGSAVTSSSVTVANSAPSISSVSISPSHPTATSTLTCTASGYADADGDADASTYAWTINGVNVGTGTTLSGVFVGGQTVYCTVTPNDGTDTGTAVSAHTTIDNHAPVVADASLSPLVATEADTLTCTPGTTTDADGTTSFTYDYTWTVNSSTVAPTTSTLTGAYFSKNDTVKCTTRADDGTDKSSWVTSDPLTISNSAPTISAVTLSPTSPSTTTTVTSSVTDTDLDGDAITLSYAWYVNGVKKTAATGSSLAGTYFVHFDTVYVTVTPTDGTDAGAAVTSSAITVANTAPVISSVSLTPTTAYEASTFTCAPSSSDLDSDTVTYSYAWYVNGTAVAATSSTLTGTYFNKGDSVYCKATPTDGYNAGTAVASSAVTVSNTTPTGGTATLTPTTAYEATTLTCAGSGATDADGDTVTYTYAWYVNSSSVGVTSSTLTGTYFSKGNTVYCTATPTDGTASGTAVTSSTVTISNTAPTGASATLTSSSGASAYEASTLTCAGSGATDADGDTVSYTYAWYVNGSAVSPVTSTLTGTYFAKGQTVYCTATPTDGSTSGSAATSSSLTISNTAPVISAVSLTPTTAYEASTFTCAPTSSDADGDTVSYTYAWNVAGSAVAGATSSTLTGTYFAKNQAVYCTVTPSDSATSGTAVSSSSVTVSNTAPVMSSVSLTSSSGASAYEASTLTCSPSATDADGDSLSYTYVWYVNSTAITPTTSTLAGTYFSKSDSVYCKATPSDGTASGTAMSSSSITISNTAPTAATATLTSSSGASAYEASTLTCAGSGSTDADGDTVSYTYAWYVNGSAVSPTSSTLTGTYFSKSDTVYCKATPSDGSTTGTVGTSSSLTISNTAPTGGSASLTPTTAYEGSTLTCAGSGATDADAADTVSYTYVWYVNSALIAPTSSTLTGTYFSKGNTVYCKATPTDGTASGSAVTSSTVTISNTAPSGATATLTSSDGASAYETSTLTCAGSAATDADGDAVTYTYAWYVNSSAIAPTTATLSGTYFSRGNTVYCKATPTDGSTSGTAATSSTVTISNSTPTITTVGLTPATAYEGSTLTCSPTGSDADPADTVTYTYAWYVNASAVAATSSTLTGTYFNKADTVYCRATPSDGTATGTAVNSSSVTIANSAPSAPVASISPSEAEAGIDDIVCSVGTASTDADTADTVSYSFSWTKNGVAFGGAVTTATTSTIDAALETSLDVFICSLTATDGSATTAASTATSTAYTGSTIGNYTAYASTSPGETSGTIYAQKITVSGAADLNKLGKRTGAASGTYQVALYTNSSNAPGTRVAYTSTQAEAVGIQDMFVVGAPVSISGGSYWIAWMCTGGDCRTLYSTDSADGANSNTVYSKSGYTSLPATWPSGSTTSTGAIYNVFGVVK